MSEGKSDDRRQTLDRLELANFDRAVLVAALAVLKKLSNTTAETRSAATLLKIALQELEQKADVLDDRLIFVQ